MELLNPTVTFVSFTQYGWQLEPSVMSASTWAFLLTPQVLPPLLGTACCTTVVN
jgi:hypothetical protein